MGRIGFRATVGIVILFWGGWGWTGGPPAVAADRDLPVAYSRSYRLYMKEAREALRRGDRRRALFYLDAARGVAPEAEAPRRLLRSLETFGKRPRRAVRRGREVERRPRVGRSRIPVVRRESRRIESSSRRRPGTRKRDGTPRPRPPSRPSPPRPSGVERIPLPASVEGGPSRRAIRIALRSSIVLAGPPVRRFLLVTPGAFEIAPSPDGRGLEITAVKRGESFLHIWTSEGRRTVFLRAVLPEAETLSARKEPARVVPAPPMELSYGNSWDAFFFGKDLGSLDRASLVFRQWYGILFPTPYGRLTGTLQTARTDLSSGVLSESVTLNNGRLGPLSGFSIRGLDIAQRLSSLTLPGRIIRGLAWEDTVGGGRLTYELFRGRDRSSPLLFTPGVLRRREAYFEGGRVVWRPGAGSSWAFHYARGYGRDRDPELKDKVFSLVASRDAGAVSFGSELATDEGALAGTVRVAGKVGPFSWGVRLRDIDPEFLDITGRPAGSGERGGSATWSWEPRGGTGVHAMLDVYQDRTPPRSGDQGSWNIDGNASLSLQLMDRGRWSLSAGFIDTPQLASPRRSVSASQQVALSFPWGCGRRVGIWFGSSFGRHRFERIPSASYDRYGLRGGMRVHFSPGLETFAAYEMSWARDVAAAETTRPGVLTAGVTYNPELGRKWRGRLSFYYRDEERTDGRFSFLAGEDSLSIGLGLSYLAGPRTRLFVDGRMRNVWAEGRGRTAFHDADLRFGMNTRWSAPVRWSPAGHIRGAVFRDRDGDGRREEGEEGVPGVLVHVGRKVVRTDASGRFWAAVRAAEAVVSLEPESIPAGYVASGELTRRVRIVHLSVQEVAFALSSRMGITVLVFEDRDGDGRPGVDEPRLSRVRVRLDGGQWVVTGAEGSVRFQGVDSGRHRVRLDVNSLPLSYWPTGPVQTEVELKQGAVAVVDFPVERRP